ncbi:MAG TPA: glutaminyl-peptide cyclotransferase [Chitinophagaceae bacterium]|nr:glutaminyl-peptide cyclotransferase [Chitinophagaceae bacterium]
MKKILYTAILFVLISCNGGDAGNDPPSPPPDAPASITYSIVTSYPHDTSFFTEGLLIYKGDLYESAGDPDYSGKSRLMRVDMKTGKVLQGINLDKKYFGEGIVIVNDTIYQLTYREKTGFMYSLKDFKKLKEFTINTEGWGMTTDGKEIIATDGSSNLYYYEPSTFRLLRTQAVTEAGGLSFNLNELEYIDGYIYANQWQKPYILKIDPSSGAIVAKADLTDLANRVKAKDPGADVLNGIAYDSATKKVYITGKYWPELYEIQLSK